MGLRPFKLACWIRFLNAHGYHFNRQSSSHHIYTKKNSLRSISVWGDEKEIPALHVKTSCKTIGVPVQYAYKWADDNC